MPPKILPEYIIEDIQARLQSLVTTNPQATFQPRVRPQRTPGPTLGATLGPTLGPNLRPGSTRHPPQQGFRGGNLQSKTQVIVPSRDRIMTSSGVALMALNPVASRPVFDSSRLGHRPVQPGPQIANPQLEVDVTRVSMSRGSYTVDELRGFLDQLGLPRTGRKADLVSRLLSAVEN